jgi:hypothetical protein
MTEYKATSEQWAMLEEQSAPEYDSTILELRARVEQLEDTVRVCRTDYLRLANTCAKLAPDRTQFFSDLLPDDDVPEDSLVARLAGALADGEQDSWLAPAPVALWHDDARIAIREVAAWLREREYGTWAALKLDREAER